MRRVRGRLRPEPAVRSAHAIAVIDPGVGYTQICAILRITLIERFPEDAQTLHAEMLALLLSQEAERDWSHLSGSFSFKVVKGAEYVYFQYSDPGVPSGSSRSVVAVLRRRAIKSAELKAWISKAIHELSDDSPALESLSTIRSRYGELRGERLREHVATSYQQWFDSIARVPPEGRALALYQDLSSAYVIGKQLPKLPQAEGTGRDPERIAEQYMLNCL